MGKVGRLRTLAASDQYAVERHLAVIGISESAVVELGCQAQMGEKAVEYSRDSVHVFARAVPSALHT